jgi:hypothetical protein
MIYEYLELENVAPKQSNRKVDLPACVRSMYICVRRKRRWLIFTKSIYYLAKWGEITIRREYSM